MIQKYLSKKLKLKMGWSLSDKKNNTIKILKLGTYPQRFLISARLLKN